MTEEIYRHPFGRFRAVLVLAAQIVLPTGDVQSCPQPGAYLVQRRRWFRWRTLALPGIESRTQAVTLCRRIADRERERRLGARASR